MDLKDAGYEDIKNVHMEQDGVRWQAPVSP